MGKRRRSFNTRSIATVEFASRLNAQTYTDTFVHIVTCDYSRKRIQTGGDQASRISSVRSVWLVPDGKPRSRLRRHSLFSLLSRCLCCRKHRASHEDVTIRTNISGMFRKPLPSKWNARSKVGAGLVRKSRNVILSWKCDVSLVAWLVGFRYVVKIYLDEISLDTMSHLSYQNSITFYACSQYLWHDFINQFSY